MTEERRASLLAYCKLTELQDDPEVQVLIPAQYDLAVNYLVADAWDRRDAAVVATVVADNPAFRRLVVQLKLTQ